MPLPLSVPDALPIVDIVDPRFRSFILDKAPIETLAAGGLWLDTAARIRARFAVP